MNVDAPLSHIPVAAAPNRPVHTPVDQATARPVERPHHGEASENRPRPDTQAAETRKESQRPENESRVVRQESELSGEEKKELDKLKARDREVHAHEAAHKSAAGNLASGNAQFEFTTGPDGKRYATGGEVSIDTAKVPDDPEATIEKAQTIRRAANAPAQPSAQDRSVAAAATQMEAEARQELAAQNKSTPETEAYTADGNRPAAVGELLDIIA